MQKTRKQRKNIHRKLEDTKLDDKFNPNKSVIVLCDLVTNQELSN